MIINIDNNITAIVVDGNLVTKINIENLFIHNQSLNNLKIKLLDNFKLSQLDNIVLEIN